MSQKPFSQCSCTVRWQMQTLFAFNNFSKGKKENSAKIKPVHFRKFGTYSETHNKDNLNPITIDSEKHFLANRNFSAFNDSLNK